MKTIKITTTYEAEVPDNFKIMHLREEIDGKLIANTPALKVGKKFAVPEMIFFEWKENADGTLEGVEDKDLTEKLWSYYPTIDYKIEIV